MQSLSPRNGNLGKALTLGALLLFGSSGAGLGLGGYACPHHDHEGAAGAHGEPGNGAHAPAQTAGQAHGPGGERPAGGHAHGGTAPGSPTTCTCVGSCHTGSATPDLSSDPGSLPPALGTRGVTLARAGGSRPFASPTPYLLPLANAPPLGA